MQKKNVCRFFPAIIGILYKFNVLLISPVHRVIPTIMLPVT